MTQQLRGPGAGEAAVVHVSGNCGENGLFQAPNPKVARLPLWSDTHGLGLLAMWPSLLPQTWVSPPLQAQLPPFPTAFVGVCSGIAVATDSGGLFPLLCSARVRPALQKGSRGLIVAAREGGHMSQAGHTTRQMVTVMASLLLLRAGEWGALLLILLKG